MPKKSKPASSESTKKKKSKGKKGPEAVSMKHKAVRKPNPFETIQSRRKFDILGKKPRGEKRHIVRARTQDIEKRKKTLLKEYEQSAKSSIFLDKRIGEKDEGLLEFDKAVLRSQRQHKKSMFNLSDGEEDELEVQGAGYFPERDDFEDDILLDEDEDDKKESGNKSTFLNQPMNSVEEQENRHKSKKEVMEEIIQKSKFFKAQKAKDKEENEQLIEQLDQNFEALSQALVSLTQPDKMKALKTLVNKGIPNENPKIDEIMDTQKQVSEQQVKPDYYDKLHNEMKLEMRAHPSDRTKTPEEIAQEEKERLEQLEEERQKRMVATDDSSDDDGEASEHNVATGRKVTSMSGDDLGDSFPNDEDPKAKLRWIDLMLRNENVNDGAGEDVTLGEDSESDDDGEEEGDEEDDDENEETQTLKDWEQSDDDNLDIDSEDAGEEEEEEEEEDEDDDVTEVGGNDHEKASETKGRKVDLIDAETKAKVKHHSAVAELPYTIEAPKSFKEFTLLLENLSGDQIIEAIRRIRKFNAIAVAAENRKKMQVFYGILLQYFAVLANKKPSNFKLLNLLVRPLMEMSVEIPYFAAICARQRLVRTRMQLCEDLKNRGGCWPSLKTLFLLRLWSMIFPCTDFRHAVMTPAILLMCEYLMRCPILSGRDVAIGSFLCSMVLSVTKQSRKFCPEAIVFIQALLMAAIDKKHELSQNSQLYHLMEIKELGPLLCVRTCVKETNSLDIFKLMDLPEDSPYFSSDNFRASILLAVMETLEGFVTIYEGLNSFPEIFLPVSKLLCQLVEQENLPETLLDKIRHVRLLIEKKTQELHMVRQPLKMRKKKPMPIRLLNPKFEENFVKGRDYDPDRERAERKKLKKLIKREAKGAARELRKDNYFLLEVKEKERARLEEEKAEKYGKAKAFLQEQEHAFKSGQLGKSRKRRR